MPVLKDALEFRMTSLGRSLLAVAVDRHLFEAIGAAKLGHLLTFSESVVEHLEHGMCVETGWGQNQQVIQQVEDGIVDETYMIPNKESLSIVVLAEKFLQTGNLLRNSFNVVVLLLVVFLVNKVNV